MTSWLVVIPSANTYQEMGHSRNFLRNGRYFDGILSTFRSSNSFVSWNSSVGNDIRI